MLFPAHIRLDDGDVRHVQTVEEHCRSCAEYASVAAPTGLEKAAYLAGLLHDMGKFTEAFRRYIELVAAGTPPPKGSVNHTFAGVRFVLERWHGEPEQVFRNLTSELIAFAIGSHHGQFDCIAPDGADGFLHRIANESSGYAEAREHFLESCASTETLDRLFETAVQEVTAALERCRSSAAYAEELSFYFSLLARQLLSAVIEGDRRDTAEFLQGPAATAHRDGNAALWRDKLSTVEERLAHMPNNSAINRARSQISELCRAAAGPGSGIFELTVPTGGGKTLAALRYSLAAAALGKKRIFFVIPLLSVLEQNAAVLRDFLGEDGIVLEHHSNVIHEPAADGELEETELLMENWRAPVVITTLVQLLNTLLAGKTSCIRRMTALCDSIIVIDEVQSVPRNMLTEFNLALNFLSGYCGATVVLCSATQPCLEKAAHPLRYAKAPQLVPYDAELWEVFRRTELLDYRRNPMGYTTEELADFSVTQANTAGSLLLICNMKAQARTLFAAVQQRWDGQVFHLSTAMCMEHRIRTLRAINAALANHIHVICVSTQLVEAGVDFSFGCVVRVLAGMDNAVQAAGRCNRGGEFGRLCPVYIVNLHGENLNHLQDIQQNQRASESVLLRYAQEPDAFGQDLAGKTAIRAYYRNLYMEMKHESQDYPLPKLDTTLFRLLSINNLSRTHCPTQSSYTIGQAFRTAGDQFHVFEDNTTDILVPYDGEELILELGTERAKYDLGYRAALLRKAARFSVSLYEYELNRLREKDAVFLLCNDSVLALRPGFYSDEYGFLPDGNSVAFMEV